jgi:hypothetical protein
MKRVISLSVLLIAVALFGATSFAAQSVVISNTPLPVSEVAKPASQPFQISGFATIGSSDTSSTIELFTVPAGKRLVIEYATVYAGAGEGNKMVAFISTKLITTPNPDDSPFVAHALVMTEQGTINDPVTFAASQPMRVYADPGTKVLGIVARTADAADGTTTLSATITISGYFVDLP